MRQSSTARIIPLPLPTFAILRILSPFRTEGDSRPISRARFLPPLLVVDLLRGVSASLAPSSRSHPVCPALHPFLILAFLSLALLEEAGLVFVAISVSSSSSLRTAPAPAAATAVAAELLFRGSHALRRLTPFVRLAPTNPVLSSPFSLRYTSTHTLQHTQPHTSTQKHLSCVSLSPTIFRDPSSPFLNPACVLLSLPFVARLPRVFSLTIAQKILPSRHTESPSRRDRLPPSTPPILLPFSSIVAEGEERASVL